MKNVLLQKAMELNNNSRNRRLWRRVVQFLAIAVVFCTTYILILPAITMEGEPVCGFEEHTHTEACYEKAYSSEMECNIGEGAIIVHAHDDFCYDISGGLICSIPEKAEHAHDENCFEMQEICGQADDESHEHTEECYESVFVCAVEETVLHTHGESCFDAEGLLICEEPEVATHQHGEGCFVTFEQSMFVCELDEHIHTELCYPTEEAAEPEFLCGMGVHAHTEICFDEYGIQKCNIPVHAHEAACLVKDLDLSADVETPEMWAAAFEEIELSGNWAKDLVAVAKTQVDYYESTRNVILTAEGLKGYTRYGEKYGEPYGNWSGMFVSFCAEYAGITDLPAYGEWADNIFADEYVPVQGDIVFLDIDENKVAETMGIAVVAENGKCEFIIGDEAAGAVRYKTFDLDDERITGYYPLPKNPMTDDSIIAAAEAAKLIENLPSAKEAEEKLAAFNKSLDKEGFDAYLEESKALAASAKESYEALTDEQKLIAGDISSADELEAVLNAAVWQDVKVLDKEDAFVSVLEAGEPETADALTESTTFIPFRGEIKSISEENYGEARVKLEFVLPFGAEQAIFDTEAMPWLEEAVLSTETRLIGEEETECQVLTGYKRLKTEALDKFVVPGSFEESAAIKVLGMNRDDRISVRIGAAMEFNAWEGLCAEHNAEEKLGIESHTFTVVVSASAEEQQAEYEAMIAEYEAIEANEELTEEEKRAAYEALQAAIAEKYATGKLSEEGFADLLGKLTIAIYGSLDAVAEVATGDNWKILAESGWFEEYSNYADMYAANTYFSVSAPNLLAAPAANAEQYSDQQIIEVGGSNSSDGAVMVSKTIAGTETENVFDITLDIITQDVVTEVYKEPDMAVVVVMDISQTMNSDFGSSTRYKSAMTAAENFIDQFQKNNKGISKIGFVSFNTDSQEIFALQSCYTAAQANSLKSTMRTKTGEIINAKDYKTSHSRFTNIESGLKRAKDMLAKADNEHKYIVFLSDGFPTTYISSGYDGYDPYDKNGTRFYDSVEKYNGKNRPCEAGTSYSDEGAIRARKMATTIKESGITVFTVGVDIGTQTIKKFVDQCKGLDYSVVDRRNTNYEIGSASDASAFKKWIGNSIGSGYDGYYFDSTNTSGLKNAFTNIFEKIEELNAQSSRLDWVATDPMGNMGVHDMDSVEFIGFFDKEGNLTGNSLSGQSANGAQYENTASFDASEATIEWNVTKSGYVSMTSGNVTNYWCTLTYRVRLKNEADPFEEYTEYVTNDRTYLTYRLIEQSGSNVTISAPKYLEFPIPSVEGYLAELNFTKGDFYGRPVVGAEFTLAHDTASCGYCKGDGKSYVSLDNMVETSGADGKVSFTNIPSGHSYILSETKVPEGYKANGNTYKVTVAYDTLDVEVTDGEGNPVTWDQVINNYTAYKLPETGGSGLTPVTFGGIMIIIACVYCVFYVERKFREGGACGK